MTYKTLGWGITQIHTGFVREQMAACYLIEHDGEIAIIETGIKTTVERILTLLANKDIPLEQVKYIIPTHVHLDHAGGVGLLMQSLPSAKLVVHPRGARHMADPSKLQAGATAVYGEEIFQQTYGELIPVDESLIIKADDEYQITLGSRVLKFYDTPGHARHHFCIHDSLSNGIFTGDTFGLAYQELQCDETPFIFPTTTPVQFEPEAMKSSIKRMVALSPDRLFLTHYGVISVNPYIEQEMIEQIDDYVLIALKHKSSDTRITTIAKELMEYIITRKHAQGLVDDEVLARSLIDSDVKLNAQGLDVWLSKNEHG